MRAGKKKGRWALGLWIAVYAIVGTVSLWAHGKYMFVVNNSTSFPDFGFLVRRGTLPHKGEFVAFRVYGDPFYGNIIIVKKVGGVAGDLVSAFDRYYMVNGQVIGRAKTVSRSGVPLQAGPVGVIPSGKYFVYSPNKDSYDSRYRNIGWIPAGRVLGVAYPLL